MEGLQRRIAVARGDEPADLVVRGGRVLSVFTREWLDADIAVVDGVVAGVGRYEGHETLDATGRYVVPGFIDAHMHFETVKLMVDEFARLVLPLGTTAVVADPHEIANVLGVDGVHWLLDASAGLQLDVFFMASSCVPASPFESPRRPFVPGDLESLMRRRRVLGLAEMMNYPGVIAGSPAELEKLGLDGAAHVDGHAPGVLGKELQAYAAAGIGSDHEALTVEEGRERLRAGMWLLIREASMARNLLDLLPLVEELGPARIAFCTDDRDPEDIADDGHINGMVRKAVAAGIAPEDALVMASLNPALWHGLQHHGAIAPGYHADLRPPPRPRDLRARDRAEERAPDRRDTADRDPRLGSTERAHTSRRYRPTSRSRRTSDSIRAIGLIPDQVVTTSVVVEPVVDDGLAVADAARDLAKIAVVERHLATGRIGHGFVSGSGLDARRSRIVRVARRPQPHRRRHDRLGHGGRRREARRDRRWDRRRRGSDAYWRSARCRSPGSCPTAPFAEVIAQSRACNDAAHGLGWSGCDPVPHALVPRALGHPAPQDHRSRPRRRRPVRTRAAARVKRLFSGGWIVTCDDAGPSTSPAGSSWRTA